MICTFMSLTVESCTSYILLIIFFVIKVPDFVQNFSHVLKMKKLKICCTEKFVQFFILRGLLSSLLFTPFNDEMS
jgi:hypothetical protein